MESSQRLTLYKEIYNFELSRSATIHQRLSLPFGIMLATAGLLSYLLNERTQSISSVHELVFWLLFIASVASLTIGTWFFRIAWFGHSDKFMAFPNDLEKHAQELIELYKDYDDGDALAKKHFNDYLLTHYAEYASHNAKNNDQRSFSLYRGLCCFTFAVASAFLSLSVHFLTSY